MLKSAAFALACSLLVGCAPMQPKPAVITKPVEVDIAVAVPCLKKIPDSPAFASDLELMTGSGAQVFDKVWADHLGRRDYEDTLIAAMLACLAPPAAAPSH